MRRETVAQGNRIASDDSLPRRAGHGGAVWLRRFTTVRLWVLASYVLLALVALLPRVLGLEGFVTFDEANFWLDRSETFLQALRSGNFADTAIVPHPGVTTMWLGSAGVLLRRSLLEWGLLHELPFPTYLALTRLPVVLVHTLGVLVGYGLLRRMLPAVVALLAALLWAADPFVIAYSRLLHTDALLATFATLSLLAACVHWHHGRHPALLVLSAACGALAVLSKSPGLAVLPVVAGIALWADWRAPLAVLRSLAAWGGVFVLTVVIAWPAVWADLPHVADLLRASVEDEGAQPHLWGNFFLGRPVETPGPLFYPAAVALRTTPLTLLGLLLLLPGWRQARDMPASRRDLLTLLGFVLLFVFAMSLFPKQFNRYLVPVFPALAILAAAGLVWGAQQVARMFGTGWQAVGWTVAGTAGALAVLNAAWWHPYSIAAFNQALGGTPIGARTFLVGWGEGLAEAADWLNQQHDITGVKIASSVYNSFQPYLRHGAQAVSPSGDTLPDQTGYVLVYIRDVQRELVVPPFDQFYPQGTPLHTVTIHGVPYVWIYQVPPPVEHETRAVFGKHIHLRGYEADTMALRSTGILSLTVQWQADAPLEQDYLMFAHVLDSSGQMVGQTDAPPAGEIPTSTWQPERVYTWEYPVFVPPDLPPGDYWLSLGLYHPDTFARLPLRNAAPVPPGAPAGGADALLLPLHIAHE
jgi:hypothetical protein